MDGRARTGIGGEADGDASLYGLERRRHPGLRVALVAVPGEQPGAVGHVGVETERLPLTQREGGADAAAAGLRG